MGASSACTRSPPSDTLILDTGLGNGEGITSELITTFVAFANFLGN